MALRNDHSAPNFMLVILTPEDQRLANAFAIEDLREAGHESHGQDKAPFPIRLQGQQGEAAVRRAAGLPYKRHSIYGPDIPPNIAVRTVIRPRGLILRRCEKHGLLHLLVWQVSYWEYDIVGWLSGEELRTPRCWEKGKKLPSGRERCYLAEAAWLHKDLTTVFESVKNGTAA